MKLNHVVGWFPNDSGRPLTVRWFSSTNALMLKESFVGVRSASTSGSGMRSAFAVTAAVGLVRKVELLGVLKLV